MASLNKVMLIGNAGRDPEMRYTANGTAQTTFSLAVNRNTRDQATNEWKSETEWFNIVAWRDLAERVSQMVTKGKQVYVEGRIQSRSWDNDQGVKQTRWEVIAERVIMLGSRSESGGGDDAWGDGGFSSPAQRSAPRGGSAWGNAPSGGFAGRSASPAPDDVDDLPFE